MKNKGSDAIKINAVGDRFQQLFYLIIASDVRCR
jgi:hypothetical protein